MSAQLEYMRDDNRRAWERMGRLAGALREMLRLFEALPEQLKPPAYTNAEIVARAELADYERVTS